MTINQIWMPLWTTGVASFQWKKNIYGMFQNESTYHCLPSIPSMTISSQTRIIININDYESMTNNQYHITILIRTTTIEYISNNIMISMTISITMNQYYQHHQFTKISKPRRRSAALAGSKSSILDRAPPGWSGCGLKPTKDHSLC